MQALHIITPVKDSLETAEQTIRAIAAARLDMPHQYTVYNDFSTPETTQRLTELAEELGFRLVNLADVTQHPSPNYLLVLQTAGREALAAEAGLCIVESDVTVAEDTLQRLYDETRSRPETGIAAAVTTDAGGAVNYPYLYARGKENRVFPTQKHVSFCCSLLTPALLRAFSFDLLDPTKHWFDVTISHEATKAGLVNYLYTKLPVIHRPHQSRPWKQLKYTNPLKYYWLKLTRGFDKI
ncbi:MAG: glycosyltransferase family 2 protein [Alloprevotella sp.]